MNWITLRMPREDDGHKYFRDRATGQVAIADWSGHYPHQTDDGVLWLDLNRAISLDVPNNTASIPVVDDHGRKSSTVADLDEVAWIIQNFGVIK